MSWDPFPEPAEFSLRSKILPSSWIKARQLGYTSSFQNSRYCDMIVIAIWSAWLSQSIFLVVSKDSYVVWLNAQNELVFNSLCTGPDSGWANSNQKQVCSREDSALGQGITHHSFPILLFPLYFHSSPDATYSQDSGSSLPVSRQSQFILLPYLYAEILFGFFLQAFASLAIVSRFMS